MKYIFKYKRRFFWKSEKVIGHNLMKEQDRMDLYLEGGPIRSIPEWSKYELYLGMDWVLAVKEQMEKESKQQINLNT